jgi:hypothetical protein
VSTRSLQEHETHSDRSSKTLESTTERISIMNSKTLLAIAAFATAASAGVHADSPDPSQYVSQFQSQRTRAEVQAEAARVPSGQFREEANAQVMQPTASKLQRADVRAEAAQALRRGQIPHGEISPS